MNIPTATYRLQLNSQFGFRDAARIVSYLADLGISHIYVSPIFKARPGSQHGYDGVDPNRLNPELGADSDLHSLHRRLARYQIGWLQDIVPNHMAYDSANRMLMDVLENGSHSEYHQFFDIEWNHCEEAMRDRLLAPFLGRRLVRCLQNAELKLSFDAAGFAVTYYHLRLPLRLASYGELLQPIGATLQNQYGDDHIDYSRFVDINERLAYLTAPKSAASRRDDVGWIKRNLKVLYDTNSVVRQGIEQLLATYNGSRQDSQSLADFGRLLCRQVFRLCCWKVAGHEINYRRFFDINELICLRQERLEVFNATHCLVKRLVDEGSVDGVRIDHVDGLANPHQYLLRLRDLLPDSYILVEKILQPDETLPASWPIQGSTGYDFNNRLNGLFCAAGNEAQFNRVYEDFCRQTDSFEHILCRCKQKVLENQLGGDLNNLTGLIKQAADRTPWGCDMTRRRLKQSITEIMSVFPVYRTYVDGGGPADADRAIIETAVSSATDRRPQLAPELTFIRQMLLADSKRTPGIDEPETGPDAQNIQNIIVKFQQLTAPLTAKGFEDKALYVYNRLVSLNEVGGDPGRFGCSRDSFHRFLAGRADRWPHSMNTTATHDSKRGEDVRARINVLSELPGAWERNLSDWHGLNRRHKNRLNGWNIPDRNEEYMLYQTLLGTFPIDDMPDGTFVDRISDYQVKALREADVHSSWSAVNEEYETAMVSFVRKILHPVEGGPFLRSFLPFCKKVAFFGIWNTLSQTLLKIAAPGVPDFYQGTEFFDFRLVDPDNRRPVDFAKRERRLAETLGDFSADPLHLIRNLLDDRNDGGIKLFLIARALRTRKAYEKLFQNGTYVPLAAAGRCRSHLIAFARLAPKNCAIAVVPRFLTGLIKENQLPIGSRVWRDTEIILPSETAGRWKNIFTEEIIPANSSLIVGNILQHFPCALLIREDRA